MVTSFEGRMQGAHLSTKNRSTRKITATHVMVDEVAVKIRAQLLGALTPEGHMAPAEVRATSLVRT